MELPAIWSVRVERAEQEIADSLTSARPGSHGALEYYEQARKQREEFFSNHPKPELPKNRADWAQVKLEFDAWTRALRELGRTIRLTGLMKRKLGQTEQATACFRDALQKWREVLRIFDAQPGFQGAMARLE